MAEGGYESQKALAAIISDIPMAWDMFEEHRSKASLCQLP